MSPELITTNVYNCQLLSQKWFIALNSMATTDAEIIELIISHFAIMLLQTFLTFSFQSLIWMRLPNLIFNRMVAFMARMSKDDQNSEKVGLLLLLSFLTIFFAVM